MELPLNENNHDRGLHLVIIDPKNGEVRWTAVFDTYKSSTALEEFVTKASIPDGYIIVASCKDDCATAFPHKAKCWFAHMGSKQVWNLKYRESWAFIGIIGREQIEEQRCEDLKKSAERFQTFVVWDDDGPVEEHRKTATLAPGEGPPRKVRFYDNLIEMSEADLEL